MHNMINTFLEQARQTIIHARIALESVIATRYGYSGYEPFNDEMTFAGSANANAVAADITPGFSAGEGLPEAWE